MIQKFDNFNINESIKPYKDYILGKYKGYGEFETVNKGYISFTFETSEQRDKFVGPWMWMNYDEAFKYSKAKQGEGEYILEINLQKLAEKIADFYMPEVIDKMAQNFGIK